MRRVGGGEQKKEQEVLSLWVEGASYAIHIIGTTWHYKRGPAISWCFRSSRCG